MERVLRCQKFPPNRDHMKRNTIRVQRLLTVLLGITRTPLYEIEIEIQWSKRVKPSVYILCSKQRIVRDGQEVRLVNLIS